MRLVACVGLALLACGNHSGASAAGAGSAAGSGGAAGASTGSGGSTVVAAGGGSGTATAGSAGTSAGGGSAGSGGTSTGGTTGLGGFGGASGSAGAGAGGSAGTGGDGCGVALYDSANPPTMLALSGSLGTHDPALIEANGQYYLFATGNDIGAKTSANLTSWQGLPDVFSGGTRPAWIAQQVPLATNLWAPDISYFGGLYHLYYAASSFGSNHSCIGHATRASLSSGAWEDRGAVICSNASGSTDNWNAIDPNAIVDEAGTPWLAFGSFWSGIKMIKLDGAGARADTQVLAVANRPSNGGALEGPFIIRRCGYYYLFVSFDHCCDSPWNYNIRVGRSTTVTGPYADKAGVMMTQGGGTLLVAGDTQRTAPGHNAVILTPNGAYNVYHALNASHGSPTLRVGEMAWDDQGWPVSAGP